MQPLLQWKTNECYISEFVFVVLGTQHVMRTRLIVICGLLCSRIFFFTLSHIRHDFRKKKVIEHKTCVLIFPTMYV
jgi:hypothetical protein